MAIYNPFNKGFWSQFAAQQRTVTSTIFTTGTREVYPDFNTTRAIDAGFNGNAAVYSIVKKDAKKFGSIPRYVDVEEGNEVNTSKLDDLLNRPNQNQGQDAFFSLVRAYYKICGESFIWLNRGDTDEMINGEYQNIDDAAQMKKPVLEMYVLPANMMIVVPDPENIYGVAGYILESGVRIPIRKTDVIHWKDLNLNFDVVSRPHLRGMSPLQPGNRTLTTNESATDATVRMNQNGGVKGVLANKTMAQTGPDSETKLRNVFDTKINNNDVKNAVAALQGEWNYMNLGLSSIDMDLLKGKDYSMKELCFLFGLPFELFDSETTYANKEMAQKGWVLNEIMPDCKQFDGELSRMLIPAFGLDKSIYICSDFDDMPELQEDKGKMIEWLMKSPITPNEAREAMGYEESTEDGADKIIIGTTSLESIAGGDGGDAILKNLYNANGSANRNNGDEEIS